MTLPDLIAELRDHLRDTDPPLLWSDAVLGRVVTDAADEYSYLCPRAVRMTYDISDGQQEVALFPLLALGLGPTLPPSAPAVADLIRVLGVELPPGTPLPADNPHSTPPAASTGSRSAQGYRATPTRLRLRRPASGPEVGPAHLVIEATQTWDTPSASVAWNGPPTDCGLVLLIAKRHAYGLLAEWQAREQGIDGEFAPSGTLTIQLTLPPILAALDHQIDLALNARLASRQ